MSCAALNPSSNSEQKSSTKKRTKAGVLVSDITRGDLERCFHLPTERACVHLGVGLTILKRLCRKFGIARWPYRSLLKAGKAQRMSNLATPADSSPLPSPCALATPASVTPPYAAATQQPSACVSTSTSQCEAASEASNRPTSSQAAPRAAAAAAAPTSHQAATSRCWASLPAPLAPLHPPSLSAALPPLAMVVAPLQAPVRAPSPASEAQRAQQAQQDRELSVLLSAIDVCEASADLAPADLAPVQPAGSSLPASPMDSAALQPWTPQPSCQDASQLGPQRRRAFNHSARSAFKPLGRRPQPVHAAPTEPSASIEGTRGELALRLAALQAQAAPPAPACAAPDAAARMLGTLGIADLDERQRLQLAEKLLAVRAALQARIARRRAAMAAVAGAHFHPCAIAEMPTPQPYADGLPPLSPADSLALANARHLLSQYHL